MLRMYRYSGSGSFNMERKPEQLCRCIKIMESLDPTPCKWFGIHCNSNGEVIEVSLRSVNLQGSLPVNFQSLKSLRSLILSSANLTGTIPKEFGEYQELSLIDLSDNSFLGEIPEEICRLSKLQTLSQHKLARRQNPQCDWKPFKSHLSDALRQST